MGEDLPSVSILLVTKNGEEHLDRLLDRVSAQVGRFRILEKIAVDSGSSDTTLAILRRHGVLVVEIPPGEFGHGRTRNLAASHARGDFLVFLTQDAVPHDEHWLANLLAPLLADPQVAGAYSRHVPRPGCHPMEWRQIVEFPLCGVPEGRVNFAVGNPDYRRNPAPYHYFANTSAVLRRDVWGKIPFPDVDFAEDQDWARRALEAGYKTVYAAASVVEHSHNYSARENFLRNFEHGRALASRFDYVDAPPPWLWPAVVVKAAIGDIRFWLRVSDTARLRIVLRWFLPAIAWHSARVAGSWLGAHAKRLPVGMTKRFSLQERRRHA